MKPTIKIPLAILLLGTTIESWAQNNPPPGCVTSVTNCYYWVGATNCGAVSYDYTNICAGGSVVPPTLVTNLGFPPGSFALISYTNSCTGTNWVTSMPVTYTPGPLYWNPPIPASFPTCGIYNFTPMVNGNPSWPGCPIQTNFVGNGGYGDQLYVVVWQAEVDAVDWTSDYTPFYNYNADFAGNGTTRFSRPVWYRSPATNNPVVQPANKAAGLDVTIKISPAWGTCTLIGISSEPGLCFTNTNVVAYGYDTNVPVQASVWLRTNKVDIVSASINWFVVPPGTTNLCSAGTTGPHTSYVTWTNPSGSTATFKRINWACGIGQGATSITAAAQRFQSAIASNPGWNTNDPQLNVWDPTNSWQFLDMHANGDCITLAALACTGLGMVGISGTPCWSFPTADGSGPPWPAVSSNSCRSDATNSFQYGGELFNAKLVYPGNNFEGFFTVSDPYIKAYTIYTPTGPWANQTYYYLQVLQAVDGVGGPQFWVWNGNQTNNGVVVTNWVQVPGTTNVPVPAVP